jgi:hypothetical protein
MSRRREPRVAQRRSLSRRPAVLTAAALLLVGFLAASVILARGLSGAGVERERVLALLRAQAAGDEDAVLDALPRCRLEPACARLVARRVESLARRGAVQILAYTPSVRLTPTVHTGVARVAWRAGAGRPVVQCVTARRAGLLSGNTVELLAISAPIPNTASCQSPPSA